MRLVVVSLVAFCLVLTGAGFALARGLGAAAGGGGAGATDEPSSTPTPTPPPDCSVVSCVALTFDDGPGPYTSALLDVLDAKDVRATFFVVGSNISSYHDVVAREAASGHVIGNHSWSHADLTKTSSTKTGSELDTTATAIAQITGNQPVLLRPPYGSFNHSVRDAASARGEALVLWDIDTEDWKNRDPQITTQRALEAKPGSIILMHDIQQSTLTALPGLIDQLRAAGYTLVTVPELIGTTLTPGKAYFSQHEETGSVRDPFEPGGARNGWLPPVPSSDPRPEDQPF